MDGKGGSPAPRQQNQRPLPTETWVNDQLRHLGEVLASKNPAAAHALRNLVGGQIVVTKIRRPGHERHYLQGRFVIGTAAVATSLLGPGDGALGTVTDTAEKARKSLSISASRRSTKSNPKRPRNSSTRVG